MKMLLTAKRLREIECLMKLTNLIKWLKLHLLDIYPMCGNRNWTPQYNRKTCDNCGLEI
jgi:hypothetical protein